VYGRYGDPGYAALMVVGIAWLATGSRQRLLSFAVAGAAAVVAAVVVEGAAAPGVLQGPANFVNVLGLLPELVRAGGLEPVRIALWSLPAMALLALATLSPRYRGIALPVVVVAVFGVATTYAVRYWLRPATANAVALRAVPEAVADLAGRRPVPCIGYVAPGVTGGLAWRVTYFTGVAVRPVPTAAAARAACDGLTMVPAGAPAPAGTPVAAGPDGLLVATP
jgi:hypothetical protein